MDENEIFREATLRICGNLEIEEALQSSLKYLQNFIPLDRIFLQYFDPDFNSMRTIASATTEECCKLDLLTPLSAEARASAGLKNLPANKDVFIFEDPQKYALSREMLSYHDVPCTSLIVMLLRSKDTMNGSLVFLTQGQETYTQEHGRLLAALKEPFAIALLNTLKHRNELRLFNREFFWEITNRICGNLEIEEGLKACIEYLSKHMPADNLYLERYERNFRSVRIIAQANTEKCQKMDLLIPLPEQVKEQMEKMIKTMSADTHPAVFVANKSQENPITRHTLEALGQPPSSIMSLSLIVDNQVAGALTLLAEGIDRFNEYHVQLFTNLRVPFFVALSNTLKHREILKLKDLLTDDNRFLHSELRRLSGDEIIGANFGLKDVMYKVQQVATLNSPVLLLGETGVGKDVVANAIHYSSSRNNGPFVSVNCGAIPEALIDSELFGHEKGAFTGAISQKRGRFERADKGTIFLDEIGELPLQAQVRLLKVLQTREIERVGGVKTIKLDIRIIAATNRNLEEMIKKKQFREDLWFRLNVFPIWLPPLRDRRSDIPALLQHFISQKARELKLSTIPIISPGCIEPLMEYNWPGNVRELQNVVERALILNPSGPLKFNHMNISPRKEENQFQKLSNKSDNLDEITTQHIHGVLSKTNGKIHGKGGAAELLGINPNTLRNRMNKLGIEYGKSKKT